MNRRITDYIQRNRRTYTTETIRQRLVKGGYDPAEIDEGFRAVEAGEAPPVARLSRSFWLWFIGFIVVLYGLTLLAFALLPSGAFVVPFLGFALLIAAGISLLVASGNRSAAMGLTNGVIVAFAVPVVLLFMVAGSCLALTVPMGLFQQPPPPPRSGEMEIELDSPVTFSGAGRADCQTNPGNQGFSVYSESLGFMEGRAVSVVVNSFAPHLEGPAPAPGLPPAGDVSITLVPQSEGAEHLGWFSSPTSRLEIDASIDGLSGTATFELLEPMQMEAPAVEPGAPPAGPTMSGTVMWACE